MQMVPKVLPCVNLVIYVLIFSISFLMYPIEFYVVIYKLQMFPFKNYISVPRPYPYLCFIARETKQMVNDKQRTIL